jgi:hypothetical protein
LIFESDVASLLLRVVAVKDAEIEHRRERAGREQAAGDGEGEKENALVEVVPQHACGILQHPHVRRNDRLIVLNNRLCPSLGNREKLAKLDEAGKSPILLLVGETVVCLCDWRR